MKSALWPGQKLIGLLKHYLGIKQNHQFGV